MKCRPTVSLVCKLRGVHQGVSDSFKVGQAHLLKPNCFTLLYGVSGHDLSEVKSKQDKSWVELFSKFDSLLYTNARGLSSVSE